MTPAPASPPCSIEPAMKIAHYAIAAIIGGTYVAAVAIAAPHIPQRAPLDTMPDTILVGTGCGFDKRTIVWVGEEDDISPLFCDAIEAHDIPAH